MKSLLQLGTTLVFLAFCNFLFGQSFTCPHDTLVDGGFPTVGDFQWSGNGDPSIGECPTCAPFDRFYSWALLDSGNLVIIHGNFFPPCDTIEIRVASGCRFVHLDTCIVPPVTGSGCEYIIDIDAPTNAHLLVYWRSAFTDSIGVISNSVNDGNPLNNVLYDMHLCTVLSTDPIKETRSKLYYDLNEVKKAGMTGIRPKVVKAEDRIPGVLYKEVEGVYSR